MQDLDAEKAVGAQDMFNAQLATYRKVVRENLMYHREVYGVLRETISESMPGSFRFLDIACGDASASVAMLRTTAIGSYVGIDLSPPSVELARETVRALPCPAEVRCRDFVEAMAEWREPVDVAWIGMSLHHLQTEEKAGLMRRIHDVLPETGLFVIWEPTLIDGEDRMAWLGRASALRDEWAVVSDAEFAAMENHMLLADFPETAGTWLDMGVAAGFRRAEEVLLVPSRMARVFKYWN